MMKLIIIAIIVGIPTVYAYHTELNGFLNCCCEMNCVFVTFLQYIHTCMHITSNFAMVAWWRHPTGDFFYG